MSLSLLASSGVTGYVEENSTTSNSASQTIGGYSSGSTSISDALKQLDLSIQQLPDSENSTYSGGGWTDTSGNFSAGGNVREGSIYDFLSNFSHGIMKANRFRIQFSLPKGISSNNSGNVNAHATEDNLRSYENAFNKDGAVSIKCHTATFPQRALDTLKFRSNSVEFRVPYMTSYEPITLSFYANGLMDSREYFELWQSAVMNFSNNTMNFYNEYVSDIKLFMQDEYGEDTYGIILYEAYPMNIGQFDVGYQNENMVLTIIVTLSYKSWLPLTNTNAGNYNRTV